MPDTTFGGPSVAIEACFFTRFDEINLHRFLYISTGVFRLLRPRERDNTHGGYATGPDGLNISATTAGDLVVTSLLGPSPCTSSPP